MPKNPPRPRTKSDDVQDAIADTRRFFRRHTTFVAYFAIGSATLAALVLADYHASVAVAVGFVLAGLAILADQLTRGW